MRERHSGRSARCAIYTRKSSEEGLEQDFNSLHAQREACEAFIKSQRHEGWKVIETAYDDGGFSGGSMERPALARLLKDIDAGRVDIVMVYKVDRLTRSLADFAKIVEAFDAQGISFVSVTQQFNTTSSMGRLTLNVLLSFAQFEREVTGERIRDKVAASKKKGLWMGGYVPLGYRAVQKRLVIHEAEADLVRKIFALYLKHRNVRQVAVELLKQKVYRPAAIAKTGRTYGKSPIGRGPLYKMLSSPVYVGEVHHKGQLYAGLHEPILDRKTWDAVQATLAGNSYAHRAQSNAKDPSLLAGLLYDDKGRAFSTSHARKGMKRYRYYVCAPDAGASEKPLRIAAHEIEGAVVGALHKLLADQSKILKFYRQRGNGASDLNTVVKDARDLGVKLNSPVSAERRIILRSIVRRVLVSPKELVIEVSLDPILLTARAAQKHFGDVPVMEVEFSKSVRSNAMEGTGKRTDASDLVESIHLPASFKRHGVETRMIIGGPASHAGPSPDPALIKTVARAVTWFEDLANGTFNGLGDLAARERMTVSTVARILRLALLSPEIVEVVLSGLQPSSLNTGRLVRGKPLPSVWSDQSMLLAG